MKTPAAVLRERRRLKLPRAGKVLGRFGADRAHYIRIVEYAGRPHVEVWETHNRAKTARVLPLSRLVHLLQNMSRAEIDGLERRFTPRGANRPNRPRRTP